MRPDGSGARGAVVAAGSSTSRASSGRGRQQHAIVEVRQATASGGDAAGRGQRRARPRGRQSAAGDVTSVRERSSGRGYGRLRPWRARAHEVTLRRQIDGVNEGNQSRSSPQRHTEAVGRLRSCRLRRNRRRRRRPKRKKTTTISRCRAEELQRAAPVDVEGDAGARRCVDGVRGRRWVRGGEVAGDECVVEVEGKGIWREPRGEWGDRGESEARGR